MAYDDAGFRGSATRGPGGRPHNGTGFPPETGLHDRRLDQVMLRNRRWQNLLRWIALVPVSVVAVFLAYNIVMPFRLIQWGLWPPDAGDAARLASSALDALLLLAPLTAVVVMAAWLTAPSAKLLTVRVTAGVLALACSGFLVSHIVEGNWHGSLALGFGALAAVVTATLVVRHERRAARAAADDAGEEQGGQADQC